MQTDTVDEILHIQLHGVMAELSLGIVMTV